MSNLEILERITGQCTPNRSNTLTGANYDTSWYPQKSAEPNTILFDNNGVAYHATEPLVTDWPAGKMVVKHSVLQF